MDFLNTFFSSFFSKKGQSVIGIDIGSSAIKLVQIKKKRGKAVLETYGELALGPYAGYEVGRSTSLSNEKLAEALKDIIREAKTTTLLSGVALPLSSSFVTFISVPPVPEKQLAEVVSIEARKYIPVPINEVMLDYSVVPKEDKIILEEESIGGEKMQRTSPQDILVVAIHNEYLNNYRALSTDTKLETSFFELELFSTIRAVVEQGIQGVMVMDMGAQSTKLYIIERGVLRASHSINRGSQDITLAISKSLSLTVADAENLKRTYGLSGGPEYKELTEIITVNLDYIFYESNAVLLNYQKKFNKNISKVFLSGGGVLLKGLIDLAKISLQTEVVYADPFRKLETPAYFSNSFREVGPEFAVAIGCALRRLSEID
jgi:type IV pilus assembly protein PilM